MVRVCMGMVALFLSLSLDTHGASTIRERMMKVEEEARRKEGKQSTE